MSKSTKKVAGDRHIAGENNGRFFKFKVAAVLSGTYFFHVKVNGKK